MPGVARNNAMKNAISRIRLIAAAGLNTWHTNVCYKIHENLKLLCVALESQV